jgi:hypothetical protein
MQDPLRHSPKLFFNPQLLLVFFYGAAMTGKALVGICLLWLGFSLPCFSQDTISSGCQKSFGYLMPSSEGKTTQNMSYQVYMFRWKRHFGFGDRWFLVAKDSLSLKSFFLKEQQKQVNTTALADIWLAAFCVAVQKYQIKPQNKQLRKGDFVCANYLFCKKPLRKLLKNLWKLQSP